MDMINKILELVMIRPEHQFYIRPDLRKAASTKAESTTAKSVIRPKQLVRTILKLRTCPHPMNLFIY
jgi:hypothetical protein